MVYGRTLRTIRPVRATTRSWSKRFKRERTRVRYLTYVILSALPLVQNITSICNYTHILNRGGTKLYVYIYWLLYILVNENVELSLILIFAELSSWWISLSLSLYWLKYNVSI